MGVKKLLKAGVESEKDQLAKAKIKSVKPTVEDTSSTVKGSADKAATKKTGKKHPGGRPTNLSKGKTSRKQYSLTLLPDDYNKIMKLAEADGLSFSKYIERAVNEYIDKN